MSEAEDLCPVHRGRSGRPPRHGTEHVIADTRLCEACGDCVEACPRDVLSVRGPSFHRHVRFDHAELCRGCGRCVEACRHGVLALRARPRAHPGMAVAKDAATS